MPVDFVLNTFKANNLQTQFSVCGTHSTDSDSSQSQSQSQAVDQSFLRGKFTPSSSLARVLLLAQWTPFIWNAKLVKHVTCKREINRPVNSSLDVFK